MLLIYHSAEDCQDSRVRSHEPERPRSKRCFRITLLQPVRDALRRIGQTATLKRLHDHNRDFPLVQLVVQVLGIDITLAVGVLPVEVVHLDLHEIPVVLVVQLQEFVELLLVSVE